jgi:glyoxylase-like metal-dependent hydrolase (beta-lactamase superfamily II)
MLRQVAEGVLVHQSELLRNNTAVVQGRSGVLLVDAGITGGEMACLASDLRELGQPVVAGFSTHADWDHVLWHPELGDVPRHARARAAAELGELMSQADWKDQVAAGLPPEIADEVPLELYGRVTGLPAGATELPWDGPTTRIVEHQAHAQGHAALVVDELGVLVAGDMLSDLFVPMLDMSAADPAGDYLAGLQLLEGVAGDVDAFIPGHGSPGGADELRAWIDRDRAYVQALRDGREVSDPRIGPSVEEGWEWVIDIHTGQQAQFAQLRGDGGAPG